MPELLVMRHAKSDWTHPVADYDRPLSKRGHKNAQQMADWLEQSELAPSAILSSAANRAQTTATYVAQHFAVVEDRFAVTPDLYLASGQTWLEALAGRNDERLLICGHNPGLDDLVDYLSAGGAPATVDGKLMTTAAIAVFTVEDFATLSPQTCRFIVVQRPRELS